MEGIGFEKWRVPFGSQLMNNNNNIIPKYLKET